MIPRERSVELRHIELQLNRLRTFPDLCTNHLDQESFDCRSQSIGIAYQHTRPEALDEQLRAYASLYKHMETYRTPDDCAPTF